MRQRSNTVRSGGRLLAIVAAAGVVVAPGLTGHVASATGTAAPTSGYTTILRAGTPEPPTCQLAAVDVATGGAVTPIGPVFDAQDDGCAIDLALRDGDSRIWAVVTPGLLQSAEGKGRPGLLGFNAPVATEASSASDASGTPTPDPDGAAASTPSGDPAVAVTLESTLVTIDPGTGARTAVGSLGFGTNTGGLTFDAAGNLWYYAESFDPSCTDGQCLYRLDPATGAPTLVAQGPDPANAIVYGATASCEEVLASVYENVIPNAADFPPPPPGALNTVGTSSGTLTPRPTPYGVFLSGIERDATGLLWGVGEVTNYLGSPAATYRIDPVSGAVTKVADLVLPDPGHEAVIGLVLSAPCVVAVVPTFTG
jgi:hypothetical protein